MNQYALEMLEITKRFGPLTALDKVSFQCQPGEIHALIGENGAGKSTLMNVLGGLYRPDGGTLRIDSEDVVLNSPRDAYQRGVGFVHQEPNLFLNLNVWENIFLAREQHQRTGLLDRKAMVQRVREVTERLHYTLHPYRLLRDMSHADRQFTEITRALLGNPRFLIMDEPTAALTEDEVQRLFEVLRSLRGEGISIIYISHRLDEVVALADRATVLKDGTLVGTLGKEDLDKERMIAMMVGRSLEQIYPEKTREPGEALLEVRHLCSGSFTDVSLTVRSREILGLGGLEGQGQREFIRAIYGDVPFASGSISMEGKPLTGRSIRKRMRRKICYVTFDRRGEGLIQGHSVKLNVSLAALPSKGGFVRAEAETAMVNQKVADFQIKVQDSGQPVETLSGGNQQKVILARFILVGPKLLLIDEPTKGIDVGSRMAIYQLLRSLADEGVGVMMLTSDMMELMGLSDRIVVFCEGRLMDSFSAAEATEERIMRASSGEGGTGSADAAI